MPFFYNFQFTLHYGIIWDIMGFQILVNKFMNFCLVQKQNVFNTCQMIYKPGSVHHRCDDYSSLFYISIKLQQSTLPSIDTSSISGLRDLAPSGVYQLTMLPLLLVVSYTTVSPLPFTGGLLSAALSIFSRIPPVRWHYALWCPDFPLNKLSNHPISSCGYNKGQILNLEEKN